MIQRTFVFFVAASLALAVSPIVGAQQPEPDAAPSPPPVSQKMAPRPQSRTTGPGGLPSLPALPGTPLSKETYESLSPEEKERLKHFKEETLPAGATFEDYVAFWMKPRPYPKSTIVRIDESHAHPHPAVSWKMEIVREDEETVWLRSLPPEDPESPIHKEWLLYETTQAATNTRRSLLTEPYYLDFSQVIVPPPSVDELRFVPESSGLPTDGRWQMNLVLADMNGDGDADIVCPPPRKGQFGHPVVFLGNGQGGFRYWEDAVWDRRVPYDYGGVAVADFNGDGNNDIVLAIHFGQQWVLYGDGKGTFTDAQRLPSPDPRRTSRAVAAGDLDGDGDSDLALIAEIGYDKSSSQTLEAPTVWVVRNEGGRQWTLDAAAFPKYPIADQIRLLDVDADGRKDIVLASNLNSWRALVYLNKGDDGWARAEFDGVLSEAYHFGVAGLSNGNGGVSALVAGFAQFKDMAGENEARVGLVRYELDQGDITEGGTAFALDENRNDPFFRIASGDLNGDGRQDIVAAKKAGAVEIYLQTADGKFAKERAPELRPVGRPFHFEIADLDGDGLGDIIGCFAGEEDGFGGLRVWLSRSDA